MRAAAFLLAFVSSLLLLGACAEPPQAKAPPTYTAVPPDDMLVHRVQAAYDAVHRSARFWPGFEKTDVKAMLIYDARGEWFFGQSQDLRGFYRTGQTMNGLPVNAITCTEDWISVYVHESFHAFQHDFSDMQKAQKIG